MSNIIDYIKWRGDITFDMDPFNEIDSLIFAELSYFPFEYVIEDGGNGEFLPELAKKIFSKPEGEIKIGYLIPEKEIREILRLIIETQRYKYVKLKDYIAILSKEEEKQFCGMCFEISENTVCVAYRGTDDSLIGWKEDFNMSFNAPIPAQIEATRYINRISSNAKKIYVCGHSKGGNLATYASLTSYPETKIKIASVYDFDGPGFRSDFLKNLNDDEIKSKITKYLPQSSIVGMIYDSVSTYIPVKSTGKGMYQHDAFRWQVLNKSFDLAESVDKSSLEVHDLLNKWTLSMSKEERVEFVEALYRLLTVNDSATVTDITSDKFRFLLGFFKTDGKTKKVFLSALNRLIKEKYFSKDNKKNRESKRKIITLKKPKK